MNRLKCALLFIIMALGIGNATAQYFTTHAKTAMLGQQKGIYYALPRTVIQIDLVIEEVEMIEGPFSDYVQLVGADDYVMEDGMAYRLADVKMTTYAEADPNATFFVAMNLKKGDVAEFYLTPKGILQGVGIAGQPVVEPANKKVECVQPKEADRSFKYQYGIKGKTHEQRAYAAAEMISTIREEKIKLLTGFQETAFQMDTYRQMYADLDQMENDYLSLFIGKRIVSTTVKTVYVTPSKEVPLQTVGKFSAKSGFSADAFGEGDAITVQVVSLRTTSNINEPSQSTVESLSHENKLFYRIPETAVVRVSMGDAVVMEQRKTVAQFGVFMLAPLGKTKLAFDPNTGQITGIEME